MNKQITDTILMVKPKNFGFNAQAAISNSFQNNDFELSPYDISQIAIDEFENAVFSLRAKGINVIVVEDTAEPVKPDAIFPNNWFSTHCDGMIVTYAMHAANRRVEIREDILMSFSKNFKVNRYLQMQNKVGEAMSLEGTGSLVLDRINKKVYACKSARTSEVLLDHWCEEMNYKKVYFSSTDLNKTPVFHTNIMMSIGRNICVVCLESIDNNVERKNITDSLLSDDYEILPISRKQMDAFAGNVIELSGKGGNYWVMSQRAYDSLTKLQIDQLEKRCDLIKISIPTIQKYGGGGIRCMIAEIFLEKT